ncbi:MAG: lipoyl(octanoyl) transferase LipB [Bacteroidales bacterium]|nr:lipoyl(octanoyl) transferase LipB [Bacteroidales bacterium]
MENVVKLFDIGTIPFAKAWEFQRKIYVEILSSREKNDVKKYRHALILCEHPHVYTLGKSGSEQNLLINEDFINKIDAELFRIDRGGDITYHGPGQLVCYPIFDLNKLGIGVKKYVHLLEESVINTLKEYGVEGKRLKGTTGVWLEPDLPGNARKICAIGVKVSRGITMHGLAFNIDTNLEYFKYIHPCGFIDKGVTTLVKESGRVIKQDEIRNSLTKKILQVFELSAV